MTVSNGLSSATHQSCMWVCLFLLMGVARGVHMDFYALPKADMFQVDTASESIIIGGRRRLMELSMDLSEEKQTTVVDSLVTFDDLNQCRTQLKDLGREDEIPYFCHYDVTLLLLPKAGVTNSLINPTSPSMETVPASETILYCSTSDNVAVCAHVERSNFSNIIVSIPGLEYSSVHSDVPTEAFIGSDGNFWGISATATRTDVHFVKADYSFDRAQSVWLKPESERIYWFKDSGYASIVEDEEYMYLFFWETPLEGEGEVPVARVARVCKTDAGIRDDRLALNVFSSFIKVQLECGSIPQSDTTTKKVYPFVADVFRITGTVTIDSKTFTDVVYAVFQASSPLDSDGPTASALCVFDFAKIRNALESNALTNLNTGDDVNSSPVNCESAASRTIEEVTQVTLSQGVITNEDSELLHLVADGERFLRVVVDRTTSVSGMTYDVIYVLSTHKFFEKLFLYKVTYSGGRRIVNYKIEVMADEDLLKQDEAVYGLYRPYRGKRMELHHWGGHTWLYITSEAGVFRLRSDDCSHYTSCGDCLGARDPHCAFDSMQGMCVPVRQSNDSSGLLQDIENGNAALCDVTPSPNDTVSSTTTEPPTTAPTPSTSSSSSPPSSTSPGPPTGPITSSTPNVGNLSDAPVVQVAAEWWAFLITLLCGLIFGFFVGAAVILLVVWRRNYKMYSLKSSSAVPPITPTNDKSKGRRKGCDSAEKYCEKPNNALDFGSEGAADCATDVKGQGHGSKQSPELEDEGVACTPITNMHNSQSDHSSSLGNKGSDPSSSDSAVFLSQDPNIADSSSDNPESPVANWERNHFQSNISGGTLDKGWKFRHSSTSSAGVGQTVGPGNGVVMGHREHHLSQGSYSSNYVGAIDIGTLPQSPAVFTRTASAGPARPMSFSRLSHASSPGVVDGYPLVGSPVSTNSRRVSLSQQRQSLLGTPDPQPNGVVSVPSSDRYDC